MARAARGPSAGLPGMLALVDLDAGAGQAADLVGEDVGKRPSRSAAKSAVVVIEEGAGPACRGWSG